MLDLIFLWWVQNAHLAMMDALMTLAARQTVGRVKMAAQAEQTGTGAPWENALLFWVNRVRRLCLSDFRGTFYPALFCLVVNSGCRTRE